MDNDDTGLLTRISSRQDVMMTMISLAPPPVNEVPTNDGGDKR